MKKLSLFLSALLISIMSYAGTVTFDVAVDKTEIATAAELTLTKDGVSLHVSQGILGNGTNYRVYKNQWIDVSCEYGNITSVEFTCIKEGTAQYGPGCFEYRGSAGTYTYDGFIGTWTGNEEKVILYATLNQVRATKIVVTYESSDANFVSQPMITGDIDFADTANVIITADEGMKIFYTLDGTDPTIESAEYTAPFQVTTTTTVKAIAYNEATTISSLVSEVVFTQATKVTCAEAATIATALSGSNVLSDLTYCVVGYVTSLKDTFNTSTSKQQFWIADTKTGGEVLYAYNNQVPCAMEVGMKVRIVGKLKQWNTGQYIQPQIVNAEITVLAPAPKIYTVSASAENGTVAGAGQYEEGTQATLTATAAEGYEFVNWTVADSVVSTENPYTFNVTADVALVANFKQAAPAKPEVVTEMVGVVKRAIQNGDNTIVLTHEADGTAHIYELANGAILELVQEGIIPVDTTNLGDYLAISDIALTEDGKLVATNKIVCQASDNEVDAGYKRGELRAYIWNDLAGAPALWFTSKMSSNWYRSVQGQTIAYKGTSTNGTLFTTGVTATGVKFRYSVYNVIDGVYTDPAVNDSEHYHFTKGSAQTTDVLGANYQLVASPLAATNWILDGELVEPFEIVDPLTYNTEVTANPALAIDLGKKFNGTSIVTVGEQHLMVAPYADAEGKLAGVKVLDITAGLDAATELATANLDAAVEATAAATAVAVAENVLTITLVADAAVYNLTATLAEPIEYVDITMTNMVATDMGTYTLVEASDDMTAIGVALAIDAEGKLVEGSTVDWYGTDMPIVSSEVFTKTYSEELASDVYTGKLVIDFMGGLMGLNLTMYTIPVETIEVTIENAEVVVDLDWSELSYAANWTYEDVTYPVSVLLYGYDEEETEFEGMQIAELQIGGDGDDDPWLDYAVAEAVTVTKAGNVITLKGEFSSYATGNIYELTISGEEVKSSVDNIQLNVESVKLIRNNQLIIRKDGREYNAQGATIQ